MALRLKFIFAAVAFFAVLIFFISIPYSPHHPVHLFATHTPPQLSSLLSTPPSNETLVNELLARLRRERVALQHAQQTINDLLRLTYGDPNHATTPNTTTFVNSENIQPPPHYLVAADSPTQQQHQQHPQQQRAASLMSTGLPTLCRHGVLAGVPVLAGLGAQITHARTLLALALALNVTCVVMPTIIAPTTRKSVQFERVFDRDAVSTATDVNVVSLLSCVHMATVSAVVIGDHQDDSSLKIDTAQINTARIVRKMMHVAGFKVREGYDYAHASDADLIIWPVIRGRGNRSRRLVPIINKMKKYVGVGKCVVLTPAAGNMDIGDNVAQALWPIRDFSWFVDARLAGRVDRLVVLRLRWRCPTGIADRYDNGNVMCTNGKVFPQQWLVDGVKELVRKANASGVYISAAGAVPTQVYDAISDGLSRITATGKGEPMTVTDGVVRDVLTDVNGDVLVAALVEWEMAVRASVFVSDGDEWGKTVVATRAARRNAVAGSEKVDVTMIVSRQH